MQLLKYQDINNFYHLKTKEFSIYFSYETLIGFMVDGALYVRKNTFSRSTGKHVGLLQPEKKLHLEPEKFEELYEKLVGL